MSDASSMRIVLPSSLSALRPLFGGSPKIVSKRVVLADVPGTQEAERGYKDRCSWTPKTETRVHKNGTTMQKKQNEGTFAKTALLLPLDLYLKHVSAHATLATNPSPKRARRRMGIINGRCPELINTYAVEIAKLPAIAPDSVGNFSLMMATPGNTSPDTTNFDSQISCNRSSEVSMHLDIEIKLHEKWGSQMSLERASVTSMDNLSRPSRSKSIQSCPLSWLHTKLSWNKSLLLRHGFHNATHLPRQPVSRHTMMTTTGIKQFMMMLETLDAQIAKSESQRISNRTI